MEVLDTVGAGVGAQGWAEWSVWGGQAMGMTAQVWRHVMETALTRINIFSVFSVSVLSFAVEWATPRIAVRPSWIAVLCLRLSVVFLFLRLLPTWLPPWEPSVIRDSWAPLGFAVFASFFVEVFFAGLAKCEPQFDSGFTNLEYVLILQGFNSSPTVTLQMPIFALVTTLAHCLRHIRGMLGDRGRRWRLPFSTVSTVSFISYYAWLWATNQIWYNPVILASGIVRILPQLFALTVVVSCWSTYWLAALVVGREVLERTVNSNALQVSWADSFFEALLKATAQCLASSRSSFMCEAPPLSAPLATFLDRVIERPESREYGQTGYGTLNTQPDADVSVNSWWTDANHATVLWDISWLRGTWQLMAWGWSQLKYTLRTLRSERRQTFTDYRYRQLDQGAPGAHIALLQDAPDYDDSPDWAPIESEESDSVSDSVYGSSNSDVQEDSDFESIPGEPDEFHVPRRGRSDEVSLARVFLRRRHLPTDSPLAASASECVVCYDNPRQIVVWPCGCLAVCDDCRVALQLQNHTSCVCCRRQVSSYSRIYIP